MDIQQGLWGILGVGDFYSSKYLRRKTRLEAPEALTFIFVSGIRPTLKDDLQPTFLCISHNYTWGMDERK